MPRVTVITATYNWSSVLPYSIGSVLDQTFSDFELLVIGDGCTDDSEAVVTAIEDPRVRWINIPRVGHQYGPNNEGLRQARGDVIAYLGHDDLWLPHHLQLAVTAIDAGAQLTQGLLLAVNGDGRVSPMVPSPLGWKPPSGVTHRLSVTQAIGGWRSHRELRVSPEDDLWRRAQAAGFDFTFLDRVTGIKFPALWRRDVYRERPFHQQREWLGRIRSEPDLEAKELVRCVVASYEHPGLLRRLSALLRPSQWPFVLSRWKGGRIRAGQRFKGVR